MPFRNTRKDKTSHYQNVSRRHVVRTLGGTGVLAGVAGCIEMGEEDSTNETVDDEVTDEDITLEWAASEEEAQVKDEFVGALHEAGVPENIDVEFLSGGDVTEDRRNQYQQWLSSGRERPDLLRVDNGWTIPFILRDQLLNLSEVLEGTERVHEDYFGMAAATAAHPESDDIYAIPLWVGLPTMQYRKDLVEEAGYDPEGENWATESISWERFAEVTADVLEQNDDVEYGYTFQADIYEGLSCCNFNEFMTSWGGAYFGGEENLFGPVGDRPITVNEEPVYDSIRMVRTFIHGEDDDEAIEGIEGPIAPEAVLNWTEQESMGAFSDGNVIMHRNWPHSVGIHGDDEAFGEDLGVMPIPYGVEEEEAEYDGTGGPVAALGGWHVAVNPNTEYMAEVLEVVKATMTDEFNLALFELLGQIPPKPDLLETEEAQETPVMGRYMDALQVAGENAMPRPVTEVWPDQSTRIAQEVNSSYSGEKSPENAMADLEEALAEIEGSV